MVELGWSVFSLFTKVLSILSFFWFLLYVSFLVVHRRTSIVSCSDFFGDAWDNFVHFVTFLCLIIWPLVDRFYTLFFVGCDTGLGLMRLAFLRRFFSFMLFCGFVVLWRTQVNVGENIGEWGGGDWYSFSSFWGLWGIIVHFYGTWPQSRWNVWSR